MTMKDNLVYLEHIQDSLQQIIEYTANMEAHQFYGDRLVRDAVVRNFEVVGEAAKRLSEEFKTTNPQVDWKGMAGMRDVMIHDYLGVDYTTVWAVVSQDVPNTLVQIEKILAKD